MTPLLLFGLCLAIGHPVAWIAALGAAAALSLLPVFGMATSPTPLVPATSPDISTLLGQAINLPAQFQVAAGATDAITGGGGKLGAVTPISGIVFVTEAGVDAMTLATPVAGAPSAGGNDGLYLLVIDMGGHAHTITTALHKINGNKNIATFGGTVLQYALFVAYQGVWYLIIQSVITLSVS